MKIAKPIVRKILDSPDSLNIFEKESLGIDNDKTREILTAFPTVYIHNWEDTNQYEVYIGESNDIIARTRQHYITASLNEKSWQHKALEQKSNLYIIGHEHFNKSMTLDVENRLMQYMLSVPNVRKVHNLRGNPQNKYYPSDELDNIFTKIWAELRKDNKELFPTESSIKDSAIFKASPLHKLTKDQIDAREMIISKVYTALENGSRGQLIFIEGEAGTGKTVLNSSTFYELFCQAEEKEIADFKCHLLVNHDEQVNVYSQIADKLGLTEKYGEVVSKPTTFINSHSPKNPIDVAFIDEAHLLWTQGKQSYRGSNQLQDIIDRSKVTVVMFDENQILTTEEYWEADLLNQYRNSAQASDNYVVLRNQLRMRADAKSIEWIDSFTQKNAVLPIPAPTSDFCIQIFDSPEELDKAITQKARNTDSSLSRIIATYDWEYSSKSSPVNRFSKYWEVLIGKWHKPWNRELEPTLSAAQKRQIKKLAWAEQPQTINEVGSTFTIQGFDLNYAGVILGPSVTYRNGQIVFDPDKSYSKKATQNRTLSDGSKRKFGETLLKHEVRVLMTRGVNGLYIYACDDELRQALLAARKGTVN